MTMTCVQSTVFGSKSHRDKVVYEISVILRSDSTVGPTHTVVCYDLYHLYIHYADRNVCSIVHLLENL